MANIGIADARAKLKEHFSSYGGKSYGAGWANLWDKGNFLPWDRGFPSPALVETLTERSDVIGKAQTNVDGKIQRKTALVPGCGRGVDVLLLESFGYDTVGLEYSATAVEACKRYAQENASKYPVYDEKIGKGSSIFIEGDFYATDWVEKTGLGVKTFDLIYDYTFFCAMDPSMRPDWAMRMSQLLSPSPLGNLICLEFPTNKDSSTGGPPHASPSTAYVEHLSHPGEQIPYDADGNVKSNPLLQASPEGLERVAHFTPKDTHNIGKDEHGNVKDFIAIWQHR